jgi:seryl-tRNA synthetase
MTEQEFDKQVWRRFDLVTTDTGIESTVMNVCFSTRSVRIFVKNAPAEWLACNRIVSHTTRKGEDADDLTIIEELHNRVLKQADDIARLKEERKLLNEKNYPKELLAAVHMLRDGLTEKKKKLEKIDNGLDMIVSAVANINANDNTL